MRLPATGNSSHLPPPHQPHWVPPVSTAHPLGHWRLTVPCSVSRCQAARRLSPVIRHPYWHQQRSPGLLCLAPSTSVQEATDD